VFILVVFRGIGTFSSGGNGYTIKTYNKVTDNVSLMKLLLLKLFQHNNYIIHFNRLVRKLINNKKPAQKMSRFLFLDKLECCGFDFLKKL